MSLHTVLSMQKSLDCLFRSVQVVDDWLSIVQSASGEDINIVVLTHVGQEFEAIRPHIEFELISFMVMSNISFLLLVEH